MPLLLVFFLAQLAYSRHLAPIRPAIEEMPLPLSPIALKALALGDDEFLFRALALWLQDVGDGGGRLRPLREYDYERVVGWLNALDGLNIRSDYVHFVAARYFGAISDPQGAPSRVGLIAEYFRRFSMADPARRWPWLVWAGTKAQAVAKNPALSARLADDLASLRHHPGVPDWLPLVAIRLYVLAGKLDEAKRLAEDPDLIAVKRGGIVELLKKLEPVDDNP